MTAGGRFRIIGRLSMDNAASAPRIEAWERDPAADVLITAVDAAPDGRYVLEFGQGVERRPDVFLRATLAGRTVATSEHAVHWNLRPGETRIDLAVAERPTIGGRVLDDLHRPVAGVTVRLALLTAGGERTEVGRVGTDDDGRYSIAFDADEPVDVELSVGRHPTVTRFAVTAPAAVDMVLSDVEWHGPSVVERLSADVATLDPDSSLDTIDVERVVARTGAVAAAVEMLADARRLAAAIEVPTEVAFAFVGSGLATDPAELMSTTPAALRLAIDTALENNQVPRAVLADADDVLTRIRDRRVTTLLDDRPVGAVATLREALEAGGVRGRAKQKCVGEALVDVGGADILAPRDRLTVDLAELTANNPKLIGHIRRRHRIEGLRALAGLDATAWTALITEAGAPVPPSITGGTTATRRSAYGQVLADRLESAYPADALLARAVADSGFRDRDLLARFVADHPDFTLDGPPAAAYVGERKKARKSDPRAIAAVESLQRLLPIAPRYAHARSLLDDGLDSALAITQVGEETFVELHAAAFGGVEPATGVYRNATTTARTRSAAIAKATEVVERRTRSTPTERGRARGADLVAHYLDPARRPPKVRTWSERHREEQTRYCNTYVLPIIGDVACRQLTRVDFKRILDQAPTPSLTQHLRRCLTGLVAAGLEEGHLLARQDVLRGVRWHGDPDHDQEPVDRAITQDEIPTVNSVHTLAAETAAHSGVWWRELQLLLVAYSGLRWGEHAALVASQVDTHWRRISVDRQIVETRTALKSALPKGRRRRVTMYPATTPAGVELDTMVERRVAELDDDGLLFPAPRSSWLRRSNYGRNTWDPAARTVGWPRRTDGRWLWTFHSLRHVFATWALHDARIPIEDLSRFLGHSSTRVTQDIYVHVRDDMYDRFFDATA